MEYIISHLNFILPAVLVMMLAVYMLNKVLNHDHNVVFLNIKIFS